MESKAGAERASREERSDLLKRQQQQQQGVSFSDGGDGDGLKSLVRKVSQKITPTKKQEHPSRRRASRRSRAGSVRRSGSRRARSTRPDPSGQPRPNGGPKSLECSDLELGASLEASEPTELEKKGAGKSVLDLLSSGWRGLRLMLGGAKEEADVSAVPEITKEQVFEDLDLPHRYRPENLEILCESTGFTVEEMKRIYRGFKTECPTGLITEEAFHGIYSRFFPHGAAFVWKDAKGIERNSFNPWSMRKLSKKEKKEVQNAQASVSAYSHYVFTTLDRADSGVITFADFVLGLSILLRGSLEDKLKWTFNLYDQNRDGQISREEMEDVVGSVFDLMGRTSEPLLEEEVISERVDVIFEKMDLNGDGVVSMDEFLHACKADETIYKSVNAFTNCVI